tara:strand:- start:2459 stop:3037 length:579 start_codon:yes stop_codon:yes gene_type:complete
MSRDITSAFNDALTDRVVKPLLAVKLDFSDGILRMWNGYGDLTMTVDGSSQTFTGGGDLMGVSQIEESSMLQMSGVTLTLSGIKSSLIATALSANYTNRDGAIYLGLINTAGNIVSDSYTLFKGKMDVLNISEGEETTMIQLKLENRLITFEKPANRMYTLEDQKVDYPNDLGFEFIPDLQDKEIIWGKKTN